MPWIVDEIAEYDKEFAENARRFYAINDACLDQQDAKKQIVKSSVVMGILGLITAASVYGYNFCNNLENSDVATWGTVGAVCAGVISGLFGLGGLLFLVEGIKKYADAERVYRRETRRK